MSSRTGAAPDAAAGAAERLRARVERWLRAALGAPAARQPDALLLVAVSGGADSMALWDLLRGRWRLALYHLDHQLREDAGEDAALIRRQAALDAARGCTPEQLVVERCDIAAFARRWRCSLESAGRRQRYARLAGVAAELNAQAVLTAHHRDDQAETVLANLLRGAGPVGRAGIAAQRMLTGGVLLLRPLLALPRARLRAHCRAQGIAWREDSTNQDPAPRRNFLRLRVLPALELGAPGVGAALAALAARAQLTLARSFAHGVEVWQGALNGRTLALSGRWLDDPRVRAQVWRALQFHLAVHPQRRQFAALERLAQAPVGARLTIGHWLLARTRRGLAWQLQHPQASREELTISAAGRYRRAGEELGVSLEAVPQRLGGDPAVAVLDLGALAWPLSWRLAGAQERWQPLGCPGRQTLAKYLAGRGVASRLRPLTAVVADRDGVLWVPGHGIAERAKVRRDTRAVAKLAWTASCPQAAADTVAGAANGEHAHGHG